MFPLSKIIMGPAGRNLNWSDLLQSECDIKSYVVFTKCNLCDLDLSVLVCLNDNYTGPARSAWTKIIKQIVILVHIRSTSNLTAQLRHALLLQLAATAAMVSISHLLITLLHSLIFVAGGCITRCFP